MNTQLNPFSQDQLSKYYAGIGSRNITRQEALFLAKIGFCLALSGYTACTGGADGSDTGFEFGARAAYDHTANVFNLDGSDYTRVLRCFLPWSGFNGRTVKPGYVVGGTGGAMAYTAPFHGNWDKLPQGARKMMARNANQILLDNLDIPVKFVICVTPDGAYNAAMTSYKTGGTGQAIRIADANNIQVFNINHPEHRQRLEQWIEKLRQTQIANFGFDPISVIENEYNTYNGFRNVVDGNIVSMAKNGEIDVLVHGLSCQRTRGKGLAKQIFDEFPEVFAADQATKKGDKSKLGTYQAIPVERNGKKFIIVNAYTQVYWSNDQGKLSADYKKIKDVFSAINKDFKGQQIHIPRIGTGFGNGDWVTISNTIKAETKDMPQPILVNYKA